MRNEASYLGILWYLLSPLSFFLIILHLRSALSLDQGIESYPAYLLIGLIMVNFFSQSIASSIDIIRSNANYIKTMKVNYEVFILSTVFRATFSHFFELVLVGVTLTLLDLSLFGIIYYIPILVLYFLFTLGICFLFSAIGIYFNDLKNLWAIASQLLLFATPVFYLVKEGSPLHSLNLFNPLFGFLTAARDVTIYGTVPSVQLILALIVVSAFFFALGLFVFNKLKKSFAELV